MAYGDRRRARREFCRVESRVHAQGRSIEGTVINRGGGGAFLLVDASFAVGDKVGLRFDEELDGLSSARAVVVRIDPEPISGDPRIGIAVEFRLPVVGNQHFDEESTHPPEQDDEFRGLDASGVITSIMLVDDDDPTRPGTQQRARRDLAAQSDWMNVEEDEDEDEQDEQDEPDFEALDDLTLSLLDKLDEILGDLDEDEDALDLVADELLDDDLPSLDDFRDQPTDELRLVRHPLIESDYELEAIDDSLDYLEIEAPPDSIALDAAQHAPASDPRSSPRASATDLAIVEIDDDEWEEEDDDLKDVGVQPSHAAQGGLSAQPIGASRLGASSPEPRSAPLVAAPPRGGALPPPPPKTAAQLARTRGRHQPPSSAAVSAPGSATGRRAGDVVHGIIGQRYRVPNVGVLYEASGSTPGAGRLVDVSETGLFIGCRSLPRLNRLVRVKFQSHEGKGSKPISVTGKVAWAGRLQLAGFPAGFGVQLVAYPGDEIERYADFVRWAASLRG